MKQLPEPEVLEWAERTGLENLRGHLDSAQWIKEQANLTLAVLLGGMGAALAYAVGLFERPGSVLGWGAAAVCVYLSGLAVYLVRQCLLMKPFPSQYNEPGHLAQPGWTLVQLREVEVENIGKRIKEAVCLNEQIAWHLNSARIAIALAPAVFAGAAALAACLVSA